MYMTALATKIDAIDPLTQQYYDRSAQPPAESLAEAADLNFHALTGRERLAANARVWRRLCRSLVVGAPPAIAQQGDCESCFMCELYCPADALFVGADCKRAEAVSPAEAEEAGWLGQFRRDSGWGEWAEDPRCSNQHWRMDSVFAHAREATAMQGDEAIIANRSRAPQTTEIVDARPYPCQRGDPRVAALDHEALTHLGMDECW